MNDHSSVFENQNSKLFSDTGLWLFFVSSIGISLFMMVLAFFISYLNANYQNPGTKDWGWVALVVQISIAIATSILASAIFYFLYSKSAEKTILREINESSTKYAFSLFSQRFEKMLPSKIIARSDLPSEEFQKDFHFHLNQSTTYKYKGDAAKIASLRLVRWQNKHHLERDLNLLLLDPRNESILKELVLMELSNMNDSYTKSDVNEKIAELRNDIYTTVVLLYDNCHRLNAEIAFHNEQLFFRTEIFDDGIFVSYYLGKGFRDTYFYKKETVVYDSHLLNFRQNYKTSNNCIVLDVNMTDELLSRHLNDLGCQLKLDELRILVNNRNNKYQKMLDQLDS